jgi:hypothetical protein
MKKVLTLLIAASFMFICHTTHAQSFDAGVTAGVVASQINGDGYAGYHQIGWTAGVFGRIPTEGPSAWQLEMKYSLFGAHSDSKELDYGLLPMNIRLHYIEIPVMYRYDLSELIINGRTFDFITLEAGLSADILVKNSQSANHDAGFENPSWLFFSVTGNLGIQFDVNDRLGFNIRSMNSLTPCRLTPEAGSYFLHWFNIVLEAKVVYTIIHAN